MNLIKHILLTLLISLWFNAVAQTHKAVPHMPVNGATTYKIGFLGNPGSWNMYQMITPVPWTTQIVQQLKQLGFNTIQLNVAWGTRPNDEILNLEDIVKLNPGQDKLFPQVVALRSKPGEEAFEQRRNELRKRISLCRKAGLRTIFHFGAPYNAHAKYGDTPPNCIMDPNVSKRYALLLQSFARDFPGVDDILVYTYDQDAWLCSEFGSCPRCAGVPLHQRLVPFIDSLSAGWHKLSPKGRLWWEPWELSAGQVLTCVENIDPKAFGLALHCNIAEVMATLPVDTWLKNTVGIAHNRNIPVMVEYFLGSPSEELEPTYHFPYPLVTLRGLKAIAGLPGVKGIKEYYGLNPTCEDPNLRMTGIFFRNPAITEAAALQQLAKPYSKAAADVIIMWKLTSEGMELFPWDLSWYLRRMGSRLPQHGLSAATLNGKMAHTPSWESTRTAIFMKTDNSRSDAWMLEDVQLRYQLAAERWAQALTIGKNCKNKIPKLLAADFKKALDDIAAMRRRALSSAYHLRETNIALVLRTAMGTKKELPAKNITELKTIMQADLGNYREEMLAIHGNKDANAWQEMQDAITLLDKDVSGFLNKYFTESN